MRRVFITDYITDSHIEQDILGHELSDELHKNIEVLMVWHQKIDEVYLENLPNVKAVFRYGVGYDNIDVQFLKSRNILFCNNPEYGTEEVSNTTIAFLVSDSRKIIEYNQIARKIPSDWQENTIEDVKSFANTNVLCFGAGRIGKRFLEKSKSLGFIAAFYDPYVKQEDLPDFKKIINPKEFKNFDVISMHCPLNDETNGIIDKIVIPNISMGTHLINTARGGLINDVKVIHESLKSGLLTKISLDVLPDEPPKKNDLFIKEWLKPSDKIIINPHTAYFSKQSFELMRQTIANNVLRYFKGKRPWYKIC